MSPSPPPSSLLVANEIVTAPPSPRQVQLGGFRSSLSQRMLGYRTSVGNRLPPKPVRPVRLQWPVVLPITSTISIPVGGYHWNELTVPRLEVFEIVSS